MTRNAHLDALQLALYARGDLGFWERRRTAKHVESCAVCGRACQDFARLEQELAGIADQLPPGMSDREWNVLASEMSANIRLGLVAGECVDAPAVPHARPRLIAALAGLAVVMIVAGLQHPDPESVAFSRKPPAGTEILAVRPSPRAEARGTVGTRGGTGSLYVDGNGMTIVSLYADE